MQKIQAPLSLADIQTMPVHCFTRDKSSPIGMLVLE